MVRHSSLSLQQGLNKVGEEAGSFGTTIFSQTSVEQSFGSTEYVGIGELLLKCIKKLL